MILKPGDSLTEGLSICCRFFALRAENRERALNWILAKWLLNPNLSDFYDRPLLSYSGIRPIERGTSILEDQPFLHSNSTETAIWRGKYQCNYQIILEANVGTKVFIWSKWYSIFLFINDFDGVQFQFVLYCFSCGNRKSFHLTVEGSKIV